MPPLRETVRPVGLGCIQPVKVWLRKEWGERGPVATLDMKLRVAALQAEGADVVDVLWDRYLRSTTGDGFEYEYAEGHRRAELV